MEETIEIADPRAEEPQPEATWKKRIHALFIAVVVSAWVPGLAALATGDAFQPCEPTPWLASTGMLLAAFALLVSLASRRAALIVPSVCLLLVLVMAPPTFVACRERAIEKAAQSSLRNALVAAKVFYTDDDTYEGFTPEVGQSIEPALDWVEWTGERGSNPTRIQVKVLDPDTILLMASTSYGNAYCIVDKVGTGITYGDSATGDPADCADPSW